MEKDSKIFIAGHKGLVGSAIVRRLKKEGYHNLFTFSSSDLDLRDETFVEAFFSTVRPEYVFLAAAKVGGILSNKKYPADFIYDNLKIQTNVIHNAYKYGCSKLLFLGSSCIYPKFAEQPIKEESLLSGYLEPTNDAYAIAKIAGIKMCQSYKEQYGFDAISLMPTNMFGPNDNFDLKNSHVLPALVRKIYEAKMNGDSEVTIFGTGKPKREFLHADDLADAAMFLMKNYSEREIINVGTGLDISILELTEKICKLIGFEGGVRHDLSKPDGTPRKLLNVDKINSLGWQSKISLNEGLKSTIDWYSQNRDDILS